MFLYPNFSGLAKLLCAKQQFLGFQFAHQIGLLILKLVPLSAAHIEIQSLFREIRIHSLQRLKRVIVPSPFQFYPVAVCPDESGGEHSRRIIGQAKSSIVLCKCNELHNVWKGSKFIDQCQEVMRFRQLAGRTVETYLHWIE